MSSRLRLHPTLPKYAGPTYMSRGQTTETYYRFRRFSSRHRAQVSHHQLRNVLASTSRSDILYAVGDKVLRTSLASPDICDTLIDLSIPTSCASGFQVTCLAASSPSHADNVVFAGGFNGEYAMLDLDAEYGSTLEGFVSHAYNGVVTHISTNRDRTSGLLRAAFCSNDRTLRVMDVATARFIGTNSFDHAINCSAVSNANRLRAVVGDSDNAMIIDVDRGEMLTTLKGHTDHIFSCAWSPEGQFLATGAEDGRVIIWDARNWKQPFAVRTCLMSSARSLNFTDDGSLVAAEDEDVVNIYQPRSFDIRQSIRFFGSISGLALIDDGAEIVVANDDSSVGGLLSFQKNHQGCEPGTYGGRKRRKSGFCRSWIGDFDLLT